MVDIYYKECFRQFHISNTLPTTKGGNKINEKLLDT